ncbi:dihydrofolate reductase family protein [Streptomyces sp. AM8-1-1]|uniref:dihydrofolate reductase family protein n=1 Tax=Streptomyces sp. AM8-1-1 TaxID=3075825 RepID=UPI0028C3801A|nr:dihydrofolate reductase family protein [Streptomyces sp. AM8-1-1]WNO71506.1 dihydrofolate reductase family protein [Streptomyces sp. AM8-1-1]
MGKLSITTFVSLDGVMQGPGGPEEDRRDGFDLGGWTVPYADDDFGHFMDSVFGRVGAFLLGRRTYEIFAGFWPTVSDPDDPIASKLNSRPKYVVSTTMERADWEPSTIIRGDLAKEIPALKERTDGEVQVHGSGRLAHSLLEHDLIDTLHVLTYPVVLGKGLRLFPEGAVPTAFRHTDARITGSGVTIQTYELAGRPEYGTYGA